MNFQDIKEKYVRGLLETNAFIVKPIDEEPFTLRSGKKSYMFLDHARVATSKTAYKAFIDAIAYLLKEAHESRDFILCNVDSKISAQMVGSLAYILEKPQIIFKSKELTAVEKGTQKQLTGNLDWSLPVAIPDDVMTGGDGTAKKVGDLIHESFPKIQDIQIFVGFIRELKESTYKTHYVVTRDELIDIVWNTLSPMQQEAVTKERGL
jgi:orotate phosphoribosyltransferase